MNLNEITKLLEQLTTFLNMSEKSDRVLPSPAIKFLRDQLTKSSYLNIKEKFLIIEAGENFSPEFLIERKFPDTTWLNLEIDDVEKKRELFLMDWVLTPALWELSSKYPEIAENPNNLTAESFEARTKQIRKKFPSHYQDIYPFIDFPSSFSVEKSDLSTENVAGCQIISLIYSKLKGFVNDPEFVNIIGTTVKSLQVGSEKVPWYLPVIHCYHPPTRFNLMITIPDLEFLSCFALDDEQYQLFMDYRFVSFQQTENRKIDELRRFISDGNDSIRGYFPESLLSNPNLNGDDIVSCLIKARLKNQQKKNF